MAQDLNIAYLISCYKLPDQVVRLVKKLQCDQDIFLIHIDKKSPVGVRLKITQSLKGFSNVVFLPSHKCYWGDYGHVKATLKGMRHLLDNQIQFSNFVVITGQDLPIHSMSKTREQIKRAKNSMEYFKLPSSNWAEGGVNRYEKKHMWIGARHYALKSDSQKKRAKRVLTKLHSNNLAPCFYGGSSYFQLQRELVEYVCRLLSRNPEVEKFFKSTYISDELFFQTILMNSMYAPKIRNDARRYVDWSHPTEMPKIIRKEDFPKISRSSAIFARKFDEQIDSEAVKIYG